MTKDSVPEFENWQDFLVGLQQQKALNDLKSEGVEMIDILPQIIMKYNLDYEKCMYNIHLFNENSMFNAGSTIPSTESMIQIMVEKRFGTVDKIFNTFFVCSLPDVYSWFQNKQKEDMELNLLVKKLERNIHNYINKNHRLTIDAYLQLCELYKNNYGAFETEAISTNSTTSEDNIEMSHVDEIIEKPIQVELNQGSNSANKINSKELIKKANSLATAGLAKLRSPTKDVKGAIDDFTEAIRINPKDSLNYRYRSWAKKALGDLVGTLSDQDKEIEFDPDPNSNLFIKRAYVKKELNDILGALADYDKAIEIEPQNSYLYVYRGEFKVQQNDFISAITDFDKIIKLNEITGKGYYLRGKVKHQIGDRTYCKDWEVAADLGYKSATTALEKHCP